MPGTVQCAGEHRGRRSICRPGQATAAALLGVSTRVGPKVVHQAHHAPDLRTIVPRPSSSDPTNDGHELRSSFPATRGITDMSAACCADAVQEAIRERHLYSFSGDFFNEHFHNHERRHLL